MLAVHSGDYGVTLGDQTALTPCDLRPTLALERGVPG
jgi:hypothetical protein